MWQAKWNQTYYIYIGLYNYSKTYENTYGKYAKSHIYLRENRKPQTALEPASYILNPQNRTKYRQKNTKVHESRNTENIKTPYHLNEFSKNNKYKINDVRPSQLQRQIKIHRISQLDEIRHSFRLVITLRSVQMHSFCQVIGQITQKVF